MWRNSLGILARGWWDGLAWHEGLKAASWLWADVFFLAFAGAMIVALPFLYIPRAWFVPQVCAQVCALDTRVT